MRVALPSGSVLPAAYFPAWLAARSRSSRVSLPHSRKSPSPVKSAVVQWNEFGARGGSGVAGARVGHSEMVSYAKDARARSAPVRRHGKSVDAKTVHPHQKCLLIHWRVLS